MSAKNRCFYEKYKLDSLALGDTILYISYYYICQYNINEDKCNLEEICILENLKGFNRPNRFYIRTKTLLTEKFYNTNMMAVRTKHYEK